MIQLCKKRRIPSVLINIVVLVISASLISACSQNSEPENQTNAPPLVIDDGGGIQYKGPNAASADVQRYLVNVWSNLALEERCGACHVEGGQSPQFVRRDSIDAAYTEVTPFVDLQTPSLSRIVSKVASGHNCWRAESSVCADTLTTWIEAWANAAGVTGNVVVLTPPAVKTVGGSLPFPAVSDFETLIYTPYLRPFCVDCHSANGRTPQQPYFASSDVEAAYTAVKSKINLSSPKTSRIVVRLREESHNCWSGNCASDAKAMEDAIAALAAKSAPVEVNPALVVSNAVVLGADGVVASSGGRIDTNLIAKYEFKTGSGDMTYDTSGQDPALDLHLSGSASWLEGGVWGVRFNGGRAQGTTVASKKLHKLMSLTGEYSVETWVAPANVTQEGPARIVSYSGSNNTRNLTLGQTMYNYNFLNRTSETDPDGRPMLSTPNADEVLQATLQHVVVTFNILSGKRIYVNGKLAAEDNRDTSGESSLSNWDDSFALILGSETSGMYPWLGTMRFLAIHNRALSPEDVQANYNAGVGEKFLLMFRVTDRLAAGSVAEGNDAYVVFEVAPFDSYSYLFSLPFFYVLNTDPEKLADAPAPIPLQNIDLKGMRIGVNGREAPTGQGFSKLNMTISAANYVAGEGLLLSPLGALVPVEQGKEEDEFFLTFDVLSSERYDRPVAPVLPLSEPDDRPDAEIPADVGIKTFAEVNANLASMTGVASNLPAVRDVYEKVQQQLPVDENIEGFLPAHHMGVTQLAVAYCNALMNDTTLRSSKFSGFAFGATPASAFDSGGRARLIGGLLNALVVTTSDNHNVSSGPGTTDMTAELNSLIDRMTACGNNCPANTTVSASTAVCAAALGSAAMLVQ
ncbi:MAG: LamG domain-containing protein [Marinagarivorans sp.]|nr:LamG domain-containing protein [Marinagarivorans sp.]